MSLTPPPAAVKVKAALFQRLQSYAVPLVDDIDSVLERLCNSWDAVRSSPYAEHFGVDGSNLTDAEWIESLPEPVKSRFNRILGHLTDQIQRSTASLQKAVNDSTLKGKERMLGLQGRGHFITSSGVSIPAPLNIYADYQGKRILAQVTVEGIKVGGVEETFRTPSQAAIAAKRLMGTERKAANTNGWTFWMVDAPSADGRAKSLDFFRQGLTGIPTVGVEDE